MNYRSSASCTHIHAMFIAIVLAFTAVTEAADKPNFVVILSDDQSWVGSSLEMLSGDARTRSDYFRTPNIERLAGMGMRFTQGYTPGASCCPTRRALQTGQMPARHEYNGDRDGWTATYRKQLNIPRMLKAADARYVTAHFGKWDHRYDEIAPAEQGYDFSDGYTGNSDGGAKGTGGPAATQDPKRIDTITDKALQFIGRQHAADRMPDKTQELHSLLTGFLEEVGADTPSRRGKGKGKSKKTSDTQASTEAIDDPRDALIPSGTRPNVLFLAIDDLNDWVGALGGHPQAKTPNLDRLISQSVLFRNAHCAAPVCSASRHALLSGLRPSTTGWYSNTSKSLKSYERTLGETVPMPTHFKRNGYKTLAAGKIFHKGTRDVKGYDYWDEERPPYKWPKELAVRGHGYQGEKGGHFHPLPPDGGAIYQKYQAGVDGHSLCWGALEKADMPPEGMPDEQVAAWAVQRLKQQHDKPFFLAVGFVRPHVPYTAPKEFFDLYPPSEIVVPEVPRDDMDDIPLWGKALAYGTLEGGDHHNVLSIGPDYWRDMVRAYLACVSFVDAQAGKVLRALEANSYADDTIVVFWSDHGQHLGEKHHWRKMALWEESTRVPLAIRLPGAKNGGAACGRAVSLLDIYPTMLGLCNLPDVHGLEGLSLLPQLNDPKTRRVEPAITTWQYSNHAVRSLNFRYIRYRDGSEELYDHRTDPNEHRNLASDPALASIKKKMAASLPRSNVIPESLKDGGTDSYGRKFQQLRDEGVPDWLGRIPLLRTN